MFCSSQRFWQRAQCDCCREWIEQGFGNRVLGEGKIYHWNCYWKIIWPQKTKSLHKMKAQGNIMKEQGK